MHRYLLVALMLLVMASSSMAYVEDDFFPSSVPDVPDSVSFSADEDEQDEAEEAREEKFVKPEEALLPFGANLFTGAFSNSYYDEMNPGYLVQSGDRIMVNIWGAFDFNDVLVVDPGGMIFLPTIGPVPVEGVSNSALNSHLKNALGQVYTESVDVYASLMNAQPMAVYVTGYVAKPGRYAGGFTDSILSFLDQAGGIDPLRGSYRQVQVLRNNKVIGTFDLYPFIREGMMPNLRLREGDVIFVPSKGISIGADGHVRHNALFEFTDATIQGSDFLNIVDTLPEASHVHIAGHRQMKPFDHYMTLEAFKDYTLQDGDVVAFISDIPSGTITVMVEGALDGESSFVMNKGTTLRDLLDYIAVDGSTAGIDSIYIRRLSVAQRQKEAIDLALYKLEQSVLTDNSSTLEEAKLRAQEAKLVGDFVKRARELEPDGAIVVSADRIVGDITLENKDVIVIPQRSDVVLISGEVQIPHAVVFNSAYDVENYVDAAGGYTERADDDSILIMRLNREICYSSREAIIPGDHILVLPYYDSKDFQLFKDIVDVVFKIAVATGTIIRVVEP